MYQVLFDNFKQHIELSEEEKKLVKYHTSIREFKKGQLICSVGEVNKYTNFIASGSVRAFYVDLNGNEFNIQLAIQNSWTGDFPSFITQEPGLLYVEALEKTILISFSYESQQLLFEKIPKLERFFRKLVQKAYAYFQNRILWNFSQDAEQRYLTFRERHPNLDMLIAQKHIASYLGMSAEFLSKIKKRIVLKEKAARKAELSQ